MSSDLRKKLLEAFTHKPDEYISGQELADMLGCSRTAIWKHIEEMRKDGFILEAVRKKGYRITNSPKSIIPDEIRFGLKTKYLGRNIYYEETVDSTQKIAQKLAYEGAEEGTIVLAEEQVGGRGRMNRSWHSPKYKGIWMSVLLRPKIPVMQAPQLTLLAAVAVVQAIEEVTGIEAQIKWPNDVLINGKKVTGILTELQADSDRVHSLIVGIGINVNQQVEDYPEELRQTATSLFIEKKENWNRAVLIQEILLKMEKLYSIYLENGFYPIKLLWESYAVTIGTMITASTLTGKLAGKALGITDDGVLLLEDDKGVTHRIYSADISVTS